MDHTPTLMPLTLSLQDVQLCLTHSNAFHDAKSDNAETPHIHDCYEIYVNLTGEVSFLVNSQVYPIRSGDAVLTAPGDVHLCIYDQPCIHDHYCLWLRCPPDSPLVAFFHQSDFHPFLSFDSPSREGMFSLLHRLSAADSTGAEPARTALLLQLLLLMAQRSSGREHRHALNLPTGIQEALDYIDAHYTEIRSVEEIAEGLYISRATMNRWFQKYLRLSPHAFLEAKKLSLAKQHLSQGKSVTEAAALAGFHDCSRFIAIFKRHFGKTPLQYQKSDSSFPD